MVATRLPRPRWNVISECPTCRRSTSLVLFLAGGKMPTEGALRLQALCSSCGHVWDLPQEGAVATGKSQPDA